MRHFVVATDRRWAVVSWLMKTSYTCYSWMFYKNTKKYLDVAQEQGQSGRHGASTKSSTSQESIGLWHHRWRYPIKIWNLSVFQTWDEACSGRVIKKKSTRARFAHSNRCWPGHRIACLSCYHKKLISMPYERQKKGEIWKREIMMELWTPES